MVKRKSRYLKAGSKSIQERPKLKITIRNNKNRILSTHRNREVAMKKFIQTMKKDFKKTGKRRNFSMLHEWD
tara:strand:+ start:398 stop:613 length:216 start_codon:yes stop_codon:yes gene_type:complete